MSLYLKSSNPRRNHWSDKLFRKKKPAFYVLINTLSSPLPSGSLPGFGWISIRVCWNRKVWSTPVEFRDEILTQLNAADKAAPDIGTPRPCNSITLTGERQRVVGRSSSRSQSPHFRGPASSRVAKARFRGGYETKQVPRNRAIPKCSRWKSSISLSDSHSAVLFGDKESGREKGVRCDGDGDEGGTLGRPIKRANTVPPTIDTLRKDADFWNCSRFHSRQFPTTSQDQLPVAFRQLPDRFATHQFE